MQRAHLVLYLRLICRRKEHLKTLLVNEIFGPTIQGEGRSAGKEVCFLRLAGCNLACIWCDTPYTWNWKGTRYKHPDKYDKSKETHMMTVGEVIIRLEALGTRALVISGGEPLLQQKLLLELVRYLKAMGWWIEVETNGTILPTCEFSEFIDQINCSPKLSNSGPDNPENRRRHDDVLKVLAASSKTWFKFVVASEQDMEEILMLIRNNGMNQVYLMPEGRTKTEQLANREMIRELALRYGYEFTDRLHILNWDTKRAV